MSFYDIGTLKSDCIEVKGCNGKVCINLERRVTWKPKIAFVFKLRSPRRLSCRRREARYTLKWGGRNKRSRSNWFSYKSILASRKFDTDCRT